MIGTGALRSSYIGLVVVAAVRAARDLVAYALRARPLRLLRVVQLHRALIESRVSGALGWVGAIAWALGSLNAFAILDEVWVWSGRVLAFSVGWGAVRISLGDALAFAAAVWIALLVARMARFVLEEDVFPRVQLAKGLPQALSSLAQYAIVIAGFALALVALGVDFTKLTIILGGLGVGLGFGLQNVVNNVASGLVLLFERAVRVGDAIAIGDVEGEVRTIGIRSSTVRTGDGAEVIVPNAELVSQKVTNWTFTDRRCRLAVSVGVAHGTAPDKVSRLLTDVARAHPRVLANPTPLVLFQTLGDSALLFELRCWTGDYDDVSVVRSELTAGVCHALDEAGIPIAPPRRAVRVTAEGSPPAPPP
jgi:small-conductance mechanosensitive channel